VENASTLRRWKLERGEAARFEVNQGKHRNRRRYSSRKPGKKLPAMCR
jgi:hypothetical protein